MYVPQSFSCFLVGTGGKEVKMRTKIIVACFDYQANLDAPGGFPELSMKKGISKVRQVTAAVRSISDCV